MNVLSLFDGMSCGRIALDRAGIKVDRYFASEIDKFAIKVSQSNWDDVTPIGDVTKIRFENGVLYTEVGDFNVGKIDLVLAGSPCQGFSLAGKQLAFDDERSKLYFVFEEILKSIQAENPECKFILENVKMKQEHKNVITERLGVEPVSINSRLVSAQSRGRLYWTNVNIAELSDSGVVVKDIIPLASNSINMDAFRQQVSGLLCNSKYRDTFTLRKDSFGRYVVCRPDGLKIQRIGCVSLGQHKSEIVTTMTAPFLVVNGVVRKASALECERLQTVPDGYTKSVSDSQRYKMLGNGWTVDVIVHIMKGLQ